MTISHKPEGGFKLRAVALHSLYLQEEVFVELNGESALSGILESFRISNSSGDNAKTDEAEVVIWVSGHKIRLRGNDEIHFLHNGPQAALTQ